jgi:signal transduction histidine kinase
MSPAQPLIVQGTVDRDGRLIEAEPRLLALQMAAGGEEGGPLVVPQLASLARLARTLGVLVSRGIVVADGDDDLDLWVRAQAEGDIVHLSVGDWNVRPVLPVPAPEAAQRLRDFAALEADGSWACDAALALTQLDSGIASLSGPWQGVSFNRLFRLLEAPDGDLPILNALAARAQFTGQRVALRVNPDVRLVLHGDPKKGPDGHFSGFAGGFALEDRSVLDQAAPPVASAPAIDPALSRDLDLAMRGPLAGIVANAGAIASRQEGPLRQDYADYANDIATAGRHLLGLVNDLADVRDMEASGFGVELETIDLADVARKASGLLSVKALDRNVRIDAPDLDEVLTVRGDFKRVLQILVNLISNAVRYSPEGAPVWVRTEEEGDLAAIVVADQGKGLAREDQERVFEKFARVDPNEPDGSGLGLYISRRLARAMGGDITVDSAPGMGARFILTLPRE